ncbi:hypothetical protein [Chryseobacterium limigenitum]|uniref:Uncharacterized protein n=1 Tax=Chryseobacterium limigenitum TaxID=1612149 RepID=A0A1K2IH81_9FLAO|nr:hypothetical protein [Chryseobacterium limigenitum]SFZ91027.1 hypothetical protein SAMN05216324_1023 [Chryseobacterium limigenitum]
MSAISALKGYRTQFLYSLHYILSTLSDDFIYRLEGEEDLDVLDKNGQLLYAIQLKNLGKPITLSDILSDSKTSFIKRFLDNYCDATPILVSYGKISEDLKNWNGHKNSISEKEKSNLKKYKITSDDWKIVKNKTQFSEINEELIADEVEQLMKDNFTEIDPIPTIGYLLYWLQFIAEKQQPITKKDFYNKVQYFAKYLSERIAIHNQYGLVLKPLHKISTDDVNRQQLEKEFYNATLTRYEHILLGLDVNREKHLEKINEELQANNAVMIKGASGQGKTVLLYSYVHKYINHWLSFELNIQEDPIITQQSIQAIASISRKLDIPTVFVINVTPNTTEWVKIIKESSHLKHIKFLVAVRNEDWYRASAIGIEFEYKEIDLSLTKEEAEIIYLKLNERNQINHFTDFEQAWIQLGDDSPLLEFVYSITQGDSLFNKLKQQILQIHRENNQNASQQIEFLKIVSLADSLGSKIDVSKLSSNIDYQFIIEKLENEYLIKKSSDRKYIQGLHIVRSQKLTEILFDEFINHKEDYAYKAIALLAEEDLYLFLLQLFNLDILKSDKFIQKLNEDIFVENWTTYASSVKALIWLGTKQYVHNNQKVLDECRALYGGAWYFFVDFKFGVDYDKNGLLDVFNVDDEHRKKIDQINENLTPKETIFNLATEVLNKLTFPSKLPSTILEWKSFGESLFWLKNIPNDKQTVEIYEEEKFEKAFKIMDSKSLSKLMLGMYSYSTELDTIRKKYVEHFVKKIKEEFDIVHFDFNGEEITIHFIIDILKNTELRSSNDFVINILDIIRTALPEKKKFNSQGYGHRLQTLAVDYDSTHKTMPIENMPLEEWVNINASMTNLYDYEDRPADWKEYLVQLNQWENLIKQKINEFNSSFAKLFAGSKTYTPVVPVMHNAFFKMSENVKEPKLITDSLGIYGGKKKDSTSDNQREQLNKKLQSKYERYFKSLSDFKGSVEIFLQQSAKTLYSKIQLKTEEGHIYDENIERLSQTNLYDAIDKLAEYNTQYKNVLGNINTKHDSKVEVNSLLTAAVIWKDFLNDNNKGERSFNRVLKLKSDFENRIIKEFKQASKANYFTIKYVNNKTTADKPIVIIDGQSPFWSLMGFKEAYNILNKAIDNPEYTSLKYLMLQIGFSNFYFIQTVQNKTLNNHWNEVRLYMLKDKTFEELSVINAITKTVEEDIRTKLNVDSWAQLYPEFNKINKAGEAYGKLLFLVDHFYDLRLFDEIELSESDKNTLQQHLNKVGLELQQSFQTVLDSLFDWTNMFPFDEDTYIDSEEEQEYFKAMFSIRDYIFPEPKGDEEDYRLAINMEIVSGWVERLKVCTESWGIFILLLSGKYITKYKTK